MSSASPVNPQSPGLKIYFKMPEGRYKLHYEKTHPTGLLHYAHGRNPSQVTVAHLREKPATQVSAPPSTPSSGVGVRSTAARWLSGGNGTRALGFVAGNGSGKAWTGSSRTGAGAGSSSLGSNGGPSTSNYDGKGTYLIFNVGDTLYISDFNSQDKDPIKSIHFSNSNPVCHAFDDDAKDGHDLLIGLASGDIYSVSLRQQLQDVGKKLIGAHHYNKDGSTTSSRCTCVAWVPQSDGSFVVAHVDGNLYIYEKSKEGAADSFPAVKDPSQFSALHARSNKSNPVARWHICQGPINSISFSMDGVYLATVGRDGYLRVFEYLKEQLIFGGKSYYGALLCCAWSPDGKYLLTGGEDDLVQVWSLEDRKIIAWGEGHNSWVSGVAFDPFWNPPSSDSSGDSVIYRFGSVGQDTQLLLWDLEMDEIVAPVRRPPGGSPTFSSGSHSAHWENANLCPVGTLQPAPSMRDVPKLSPLVAHRAHLEPLSGLVFADVSVLTICRDGHLKIWARPEPSNVNPPVDAEVYSSGKPSTPQPVMGNDGSTLPPIQTQDC
ncbi:catabolite repression protein creC-like [Wolffia australiana]